MTVTAPKTPTRSPQPMHLVFPVREQRRTKVSANKEQKLLVAPGLSPGSHLLTRFFSMFGSSLSDPGIPGAQPMGPDVIVLRLHRCDSGWWRYRLNTNWCDANRAILVNRLKQSSLKEVLEMKVSLRSLEFFSSLVFKIWRLNSAVLKDRLSSQPWILVFIEQSNHLSIRFPVQCFPISKLISFMVAFSSAVLKYHLYSQP